MHKIAIVGANGRLGQEAQKAVKTLEGFVLANCINRHDDLQAGIENADIIIDVTLPDCVFEHATCYQKANKKMIIGTSGLGHEQIATLQAYALEHKLGGIIAPNFSIGALLMMVAAKQCAAFFPNASIVETHHIHKKDAPSGTALKTAHMMQQHMAGDIPIHAQRLPGAIAEQIVRLGGNGETLTIEHRMIDRSAFIPGIQLACKKILNCQELVYGLESFLLKSNDHQVQSDSQTA